SAKGKWHSKAPWEFCTREEVVSAFEGFHPEVCNVIEAAPQLTKWPILDIELVDTWSKGRLVLLGGACHATPAASWNSSMTGSGAMVKRLHLGRAAESGVPAT